jgi:hypothetical protein
MFKEYREPPRREPDRRGEWRDYVSWQRIAALIGTAILVTGILMVNFEDMALRGG